MHHHRAKDIVWISVLTVALVLGACGKSETPTAEKAAPLTSAPAGDKAAAPKAGADKAPAPTKAATPSAGAASDKAPAVSRVELPDDVVAVAAVRSLDAILTSAKAALELLDPAAAQPGFVSATKEAIKESLGWKDISWMAGDKPIRSILFNAKQFDGKAQFLAFPMANKDAVLAALPEGAKQKDGEHAAKYTNNGQTVFVDFLDGYAIYSDHPSFFAKGKALFSEKISKWEPTRDLELKLDLDNIYALYLPELSQAKQQILASYMNDDETMGVEGIGAVIALQVEGLFAHFESSHQSDLNIWFDGSALRASIAFIPKANTLLDTFAKTNKDKRSSFLKSVPETAYVSGAMNIDLRKLAPVMAVFDKATIASYKQFADLRPEDEAAIQAQLDIITKHSQGDAAASVYVDGEFPGAMVAVTRVDDAKAVTEAYAQIIGIVVQRALAKMSSGGGDLPPQLTKAKSLAEVVTFINGMGAAFGAKLELIEYDPKNPKTTKEGVPMAGLRVNMDWARFAAATQIDQAEPELFKTLTGVLGGRFELMGMMKDNLLAMAFGPNATKVAAEQLTGASTFKGESGLNRLGSSHIGAVTFRLDTVLRALSFVPQIQAKGDLVKKVPRERPVAFTYDTDGTTVSFGASMPLDVMRAVGAVQD